MTCVSAKATGLAVSAALLSGLGLNISRSTLAQSSNSVGGQAYGVFVQTPTASIAQSPLATLNPVSGIADAAAAAVSVPGVLTAESLGTITTGVVGENAATAQSGSTLENVNILGGVITAELVSGQASSASNGSTATSNGAGSGFAGLLVNGIAVGDSPPPNQQIALPGIGTVTVNEQTPRGNGQTTSGLTVNMIHVRLIDFLTGAPTGEIVLGSAQSDAAFVR